MYTVRNNAYSPGKVPMESCYFRPFHKGAYENLWSEQRFDLLAISFKRTRQAASKLGRTAHPLAFLQSLSRSVGEPRPEINNALLNVYDHVRPFLTRKERSEVVERLLAEDPTAPTALYELVRRKEVQAMYGCRLFFPPKALNKFWDFGTHPGLVICLGPYLVHLTFSGVRLRFQARAGLSGPDLDARLAGLSEGLSPEEYGDWPTLLRETLENHAAVARTPHRVWLHPRVVLPLPPTVEEPASSGRGAGGWPPPSSPELLALLTLEQRWDAAPGTIPDLPDFETWLAGRRPECLPEIRWPPESNPVEEFNFLMEGFLAQKNLECGRNDGPAAEVQEEDTNGSETDPLV